MRQRVGAGSFGEVYLATMSSPGGIRQEVAVKILAQDLDPRSQPVERMRDEGRILGALNHPVILQVRDLVVLGGRIGLVTEYVPGADLSEVVERHGPLPPRTALQLVGHLGDALDAAWHAEGPDGARLFLVHRDLKPANVRLTPHGTVKLLDFGIAKMQSSERETATQYTVLMGSVPYMAPEVLHMDDEDAHVARDVFALGCVCFEVLTGELWFADLKRRELRTLTARPERYGPWRDRRLELLEGRVAPEVVELLRSMLAHDDEQRPTPRAVADRAFELSDGAEGPSLRGWARLYPWPTEQGDVGSWTGQRVQETTLSTASDGGGWLDESPRTSPVVASRPGIASMGPPSEEEPPSSVTDWLTSDEEKGAPAAVPAPRRSEAPLAVAVPAPAGPSPTVVVALATLFAVGVTLAVASVGGLSVPHVRTLVGGTPELSSASTPAEVPEPAAAVAAVVSSALDAEGVPDPVAANPVPVAATPEPVAAPPQAAAVSSEPPAPVAALPGREPVAPPEATASAEPSAPPVDEAALAEAPVPEPVEEAEVDKAAAAPAPAPRVVEPVVRRAPVEVARAPVADQAPAGTFAIDLAAQGRVELLAGEGVAVELHRGDQVIPPGAIAPGSVEVHADFGDGMRKRLVVVVPPAGTVRVRCLAELGVCENVQ